MVKNPHIIHMLIDVEGRDKYLCIQACDPTPSKSTRDPSKVTCKNCLRLLEASEKRGYDLICQNCLDLFNKAGADIKTHERVKGARCWRCLAYDANSNPVYRLRDDGEARK